MRLIAWMEKAFSFDTESFQNFKPKILANWSDYSINLCVSTQLKILEIMSLGQVYK